MMTPPLAMPAATRALLQRRGPVVVLPDGALGQKGLGVGLEGREDRRGDVGQVETGHERRLRSRSSGVAEVLGLLGQGGHAELDPERAVTGVAGLRAA